MTPEEIKRAKSIVSGLLSCAASPFPVLPLLPEDSELVSRYLALNGRTVDQLGQSMKDMRALKKAIGL